MLTLFNSKNRMTSLIATLLVIIGFAFNACSGVKFARSANPSIPGVDNPLDDTGDDDTGDDDDDDDDDDDSCTGTACGTKYTDNFVIPFKSEKVDILLVVDDSLSMKDELSELASRLNGMVERLEDAGADWQMCYTTTYVALNPEAGEALNWMKTNAANKVVSAGTHVLKKNTADKENLFLTTMGNITVGKKKDGTGAEQGIAATRIALDLNANKDCFRNKAALSVVYISDEDEASCGARCKTKSDEPTLASWKLKDYTEGFMELSEFNKYNSLMSFVQKTWSSTKNFVAHAIVIKPGDKTCWKAQDSQAVAFYGKEYAKLQTSTGGILGDICAASYSSQLEKIADRTAETMASVTLRCSPTKDPTVTVTPSPGELAISRAGNKIFFSPALEEGVQVSVTYYCK